jgi:hypothetical protein
MYNCGLCAKRFKLFHDIKWHYEKMHGTDFQSSKTEIEQSIENFSAIFNAIVIAMMAVLFITYWRRNSD